MGVSQLFIPEILDALQAHDPESLREIFENLHPSDIAELLERIESEKVAEILKALTGPQGIAVFEQLSAGRQAEVLRLVGRKEMVRILEELSADDRVDAIRQLPSETVDEILPMMAQAERDDVKKLLQYAEGTAGSVMTTEYAALPPDITVADALDRLRKIAPERETISDLFLVDAERRLVGQLRLRNLVLAKPDTRIDALRDASILSMRVEDDREEVARAIAKYDVRALPIVDAENRLVGIVTHDDVIDILQSEQTEDVHRMGAVGMLDVSYLKADFWKVAGKRGAWLAILFVGGTLTIYATHRFGETLKSFEHLAWFLPLIIASGGNSGSQSATLVTRALALGEIGVKDWLRILSREFATSLVLGSMLGAMGFAMGALWGRDAASCAVIGMSVSMVVLFGTIIGGLLPVGLKRAGLDPAITSSPFISCLVDVSGIVIYLTVATMILS